MRGEASFSWYSAENQASPESGASRPPLVRDGWGAGGFPEKLHPGGWQRLCGQAGSAGTEKQPPRTR